MQQIFDRTKLKTKKNLLCNKTTYQDFLLKNIINQILPIAFDILDNESPKILILGSHSGQILDYIKSHKPKLADNIIQTNTSYNMSTLSPNNVIADEEFIPFKSNTFDAVISIGNLHWVNDLDATFSQIFQILKPNGLFLSNLFGPKTLSELRHSLALSESPAVPRVSPFITLKDAGSLLQNNKFSHIITDTNTLSIKYSSPLTLMKDLINMAETNSLYYNFKPPKSPSLISKTIENYRKLFTHQDGKSVLASIEIITLIAKKTPLK